MYVANVTLVQPEILLPCDEAVIENATVWRIRKSPVPKANCHPDRPLGLGRDKSAPRVLTSRLLLTLRLVQP